MTNVQIIDHRKLKAQQAYVNAYYEDNVFLADNPKAFFQLWQLLDEHKNDWQKELKSNMLYYRTRQWLDGLFENEDAKQEMALSIEDIVKLVMNNITTLPGCKCKLRALKAEAK